MTPNSLQQKKQLRGIGRIPYKYQVLRGNESSLMIEALQRRSWWKPVQDNEQWNFWWGVNGQKFSWSNFRNSCLHRQMVCRHENNVEICTKTRLARNIQTMFQKNPGLNSSWFYKTFVINSKAGSFRVEEDFKIAYQQYLDSGAGKVWIIKPGFRNRGNGIILFDNVQNIFQHINQQATGSSWVVQKYMENPMLFNNRKFDIRSFVLVTSDKRVHFYKQSYVRTSGQEFDLSDLSSRATHLTNDAVQKKSNGYGQFEDHNKMSLQQLQQALGSSIDVEGNIVPQMKSIIRQVMGTTLSKLNPRFQDYSFELYGVDFIIDENSNVVLLEINTCPALLKTGSYLKTVLPRLIEEVVQKTLDQYFPAPPEATIPEQLNDFEENVNNGILVIINVDKAPCQSIS
eukprot:TRINITY_DN949_c1_g1_i1.p1 TRINITY_DN949_c1_g1~~TRINITY_DN949_c1_g1_i1.p1  ORF type:complete len:400 (+),score=36.77 TRINITY_DN949_c1_g1_i1:171-1370(+)